jgi:uncharacterized protein (DUF58 family)
MNNDKVGLLIFSDRVEHLIAPRKGRNHVLRIIRDLLAVRPSNRGTDLSLALRTINRVLKQRAIVFFMSDFLASRQEYERDLQLTGGRHDLIAVVLRDPLEERWPGVGLVALQDAETDRIQWVDAGAERWRAQFENQSTRFRAMREDVLNKAQVDRVDLTVDADYVRALTEFFRRRMRRSQR